MLHRYLGIVPFIEQLHCRMNKILMPRRTVAVKKKFTFSYRTTIVLRRIRSIKTEEKRSKNMWPM